MTVRPHDVCCNGITSLVRSWNCAGIQSSRGCSGALHAGARLSLQLLSTSLPVLHPAGNTCDPPNTDPSYASLWLPGCLDDGASYPEEVSGVLVLAWWQGYKESALYLS